MNHIRTAPNINAHHTCITHTSDTHHTYITHAPYTHHTHITSPAYTHRQPICPIRHRQPTHNISCPVILVAASIFPPPADPIHHYSSLGLASLWLASPLMPAPPSAVRVARLTAGSMMRVSCFLLLLPLSFFLLSSG